MNIFKTILSISLLLLGSYGLNAQIAVNAAPTAAQLVTNTLIGNGVSVSNITFVGHASQ